MGFHRQSWRVSFSMQMRKQEYWGPLLHWKAESKNRWNWYIKFKGFAFNKKSKWLPINWNSKADKFSLIIGWLQLRGYTVAEGKQYFREVIVCGLSQLFYIYWVSKIPILNSEAAEKQVLARRAAEGRKESRAEPCWLKISEKRR